VFIHQSNVTAQNPQITSIVPSSAVAGSNITINGNNFNPTASGNVVYFGKVTGNVVSASTNSLIVTVPNAADNGPVTVICNGKSVRSISNFKPIFSGGAVKPADFAGVTTISMASSGSFFRHTAADLDRDGHPDLIVPIFNNSQVNLYRHNGTQGSIGFSPAQSFSLGISPFAADYADFDNDGLLDLAIGPDGSSLNLCVKRNNSTGPGVISLSTTNLLLATNSTSYALGTGDFNNDGLMDIAAGLYNSPNVRIFLNTTSTQGIISFSPGVDINITQSGIWHMNVCDYDLDGKVDIAVTSVNSNFIRILRNTTPNGSSTPSFTVSFITGATTATEGYLQSGDMNNDNLPDLVWGSGSNGISVFTNQSALNTISFSTPLSITTPNGSNTNIVGIDDFNGDGNNDIATYGGTILSIFPNAGNTIGLITGASFLARVDFATTLTNQYSGVVADFNRDGRKDIISTSAGTGIFSYRHYITTCPSPNITSQPQTTASCVGGNAQFSVVASGNGNITYQWYKNGVLINGATSSTLSFSNISVNDSGSYHVVISDSCVLSSLATVTTSNTVRLLISNGPVVQTQPTNQSSCGDAFLFSVNALSSSPITYQWYRNSSIISGGNGQNYTKHLPSFADTGRYFVQLTNSCGTINSDTVSFSFTPVNRPSVADNQLCNQTGSLTFSNTTPLATHLTRWYDDGNFTLPLGSNNTLNRSYVGQDTLFVRHEYNPTILEGIGSINQSTFAGDDRSAIAVTKNYLFYTGDNATVRYRMPELTNPTTLSLRDGIFSTYGDTGMVYSLGTASGPWFTFSTSTPATHLHVMDSNLNAVSNIPFTGITSISSSNSSFIASGPNFILYRSGSVLYKINTTTGFVSNLSSNITNFNPLPSEGWASWGFVDSINGNHYIYYHSSGVNTNGISIYHVESNSNTDAFNPGALNVISDLAALSKAPWYDRWYFKHETGTLSTLSSGVDEVLAYCSNPMRFTTRVCNSASDTAVIIYTFPIFTSQPSSLDICAGGSALFTAATTTNLNYTYQWRKNGVNIPGATNDTLILNPVVMADTGVYTLVVSNSCNVSITSNNAALTVRGVRLLNQPVPSFNCPGEPITLSCSAIGSGLVTYQWRKNGIAINGANQNTYNISALTPADTGLYSVVITDSCGIPITSNSVSVSISSGPQIISISNNQALCNGNSFSLNVNAIGSGTLNYQWVKNGQAINGATTPSYFDSSFADLDTGNYSVIITDNCGLINSSNITITNLIINPPVIANQTFCVNNNYTFTNTSVTPSGFITRWYDNSNLTGLLASGNSLTRFLSQTDSFFVRNEPNTTSLSGVGAVEHDPFSGDDRGGIAVTKDYFFYVGDVATVRFRMPNLTNGVSLTIRDGIFATYGGNGTVYSFGTSSGPWGTFPGGNITHVFALDSNLNAILPGVILTTSIAAVSGSTIIASGPDFVLYKNNVGIYKIIPSTGIVTLLTSTFNQLLHLGTENWSAWGFAEMINNNHYIYYRSSSININGITRYHVEGNSNTNIFTSAGNILGDMACLSNAPWYNRWYFHFEGSATSVGASISTSEAAIYCDAPMRFNNSGCNSTVDTVIATRNVVSIIQQPQSVSTCSGSQTTFSVSATGINLTYQWRKNGVNIPGATSSSLSFNNLTYADSGIYSVIVTSNCGSVLSNNAILNIRGVNIISQPTSIRNCGGQPATLSVIATGNGIIQYQWFKNGIALSGATNNSYSISSLTFADTGVYTVRITDSCGLPVFSNNVNITLSTGPSIVSLTGSSSLCLGGVISLAVGTINNGMVSYQWRKNGTNINGSTGANHNLFNFSAADTGNYSVIINDICGQTISPDINMTLNVQQAPIVNDASVCSSGSSVMLTNTATVPSGYITRWYDDAALTVLLGQGNSLIRVVNGLDYYYVRNEGSNGCVTRVDTVMVFVSGSNTWTGNTNTNWFNTTNWSCGVVPNSLTNAIIPAGATNMPIVVNGLTANVHNLTIQLGAQLTLQGSSSLNIYGNLNRLGNLITSISTINFLKNTDTIFIPAGNYHNMSIGANSFGASLTGNVTLENNLLFTGNCILRLDNFNFTQLNYQSTGVSGAGNGAFISTNQNGKLRIPGIGNGALRGTSAFAYLGNSTYNPLSITNSGIIDTLEISIYDNVFMDYNNFIPTTTAITNNVVNRSWLINEVNPGGSILTVSPGWQTSNETPGFNRNSCYVAQYNNNMWMNGTAGPSALSNGLYFRPQSGYSTAGIFGIASNNVLPVTFINFSATKIENHGQLNWTTASERNNAYFIIEASADGIQFIEIGKVTGFGNSNSIINYHYVHHHAALFANTVYYRLKQVDMNGGFHYSTICQLNFEKTVFAINVVPNPFSSAADIIIQSETEESAQLKLIDANGKIVQTIHTRLVSGTNNIPIVASLNLAPGVYFVQLVTENGTIQSVKLIKQ